MDTTSLDTKAFQPTVRYIEEATGREIPLQDIHLETPDIDVGHVVEIQSENSKKDYFSISSIVEGEPTTVYLVRARNSLWKSLLLLVILGVGWYAVDYVLKLMF